MPSALPTSAQRVQTSLEQLGLSCQVVELPASTRTAQDAAQALGTTVGQIAKSLVFRSVQTASPILVVASGTNRVNEQRIAELIGQAISKADATFVREHTGFSIGGVAPLAHPAPIPTYIDIDLLHYETIWAAGGTPNTVFRLTPAELLSITSGVATTIT